MDRTILATYLKKLKDQIAFPISQVDGWQYRTADYHNPGTYNYDTSWLPVTGKEIFPKDKTLFLKTRYTFSYDLVSNQVYQDYLFIHIAYLEGYLRVNGEVYHGLDRNRDRIPIRQEWLGETVELELELFTHNTYTDHSEQPWFDYAEIRRVNQSIESFYFDLKLAIDTYFIEEELIARRLDDLTAVQSIINTGSAANDKLRIMKAIDQSLMNLDLSVDSKLLEKSVIDSDRILKEALSSIDDGSNKGRVSLIGHTHIDVAWLWQLKDTVRKCGHSFANMLRLSEEFPEFTFTCSQPQLYQYTKQYYPELYAKIKEKVADGQWELVGPMWVESDCNVTSGESLVRQLLHGHKFYMSEFGKSSDICWLPDTFGFQPNMPQILSKSGLKYFFSYKLHWQAHNRFPYGSFRWRGIDGTDILASVPELLSGYNGNPVPAQLKYAQDNNLQKKVTYDVIFPYGWGDGGGGPTRDMYEYARRLAKYPSLPESRMVTAKQFFEELSEQSASLPVWYGEMALETHRGTFTTHGDCKVANRKCEQLLQTAEKLAVFSGLAEDHEVADTLKAAWQTVLLLQFHDILPGSSIKEVYDDAKPMYEDVYQAAHSVIHDSFQKLGAAALQVSGHKGLVSCCPAAVTVFNPLSWTRHEVIELSVPCSQDESISVTDVKGQLVQSEEVSRSEQRATIIFKAQNICALGFASFHLQSDKRVEKKTAEMLPDASVKWEAGRYVIETARYAMVLEMSGQISRLFDKLNNRDVVKQSGNDICLYHDGPQGEDAWNLYAEYRCRPFDIGWDNHLQLIENNRLRTCFLLSKKSGKSSIEQKITLNHMSGCIEFDTSVDWQERFKLLKVGFDLAIESSHAYCDTGFGSFARPTIANNPYDKEKFEVVAHKWVDLSEGNYGVTVFNDCKYGHSIEESTVEISLLRSTGSPDPAADQGLHAITYVLYPHKGDWRQANVPKKGYEINTDVIIGHADPANIENVTKQSYFTVASEDLVLDTVKPAWDGDDVILRFHEINGNRGQADLSCCFEFKNVTETDLMEQEIKGIDFAGRTFRFDYRPYEIKTYKVQYK